MNTKKIESLLRTFGIHMLTVLGGLLLILNPAEATAMVTRMLGWLLVGVGSVKLILPVTNHRPVSGSEWVWNGLCILAGLVLLARPLILADLMGRVLGVMILVGGVQNLRDGVDGKDILSILAGVILLMMPRTLTNTVLVLVGVVLMIIGIVNIIGRVKTIKRLEERDDPNIIDAL